MNEYEIEQSETADIEIAERMQVFGSRLRKLAAEQSQKRAVIEERWLRDLRQYHGKYSPDEETLLNEAKGSTVFVNITRNKSNGAEARIGDMLFPTDDRNWAINPTPVPSLKQAKKQPEMAEQAAAIMREAEDKADLMQDEIDDQLVESKYQSKARDMIHDAVVLGTGIIKGPIIVGKMKKKWEPDDFGNFVLSMAEDLSPVVEYVDVWRFYPDMSTTRLSDCEFFFEQHRWTKKQLRDFARLPNVFQDHVKKVVSGGTSKTIATDRESDVRAITGISTYANDNRYEVWEYHGPISKQELLDAMTSTADESLELEEISELDDEMEATVFFSDCNVLKVAINPMDTQEKPYSALVWERDDASPFGFGVPYLMSSAQKVINSSWRMMLDNAGQSVTDQIVVNDGIIEPIDGNWTMGPKKIWRMTDVSRSVQDAFGVFETRNHQNEYANIIQMARQFADEETNMPLIAQGEQSSNVTKTSSGMAMLMNSANIVLRRAVKNWDDDVTNTLIPRFYDWNMQFNNKQEIKGDQTIEARGSSALLVREKQQENLMVFANLSASNPELAMRRDWEGLDKEMAKSLEVPYNNITLSDEEIEQRMQEAQQQQPPEDPNVQFKGQELQIRQQEMELKSQVAQQELQIKIQDGERNYELRVAELALKEGLTMAQMQSKLDADLRKDQTARDKAAAEISLKSTQANLQAQNLSQGFDTF